MQCPYCNDTAKVRASVFDPDSGQMMQGVGAEEPCICTVEDEEPFTPIIQTRYRAALYTSGSLTEDSEGTWDEEYKQTLKKELSEHIENE